MTGHPAMDRGAVNAKRLGHGRDIPAVLVQHMAQHGRGIRARGGANVPQFWRKLRQTQMNARGRAGGVACGDGLRHCFQFVQVALPRMAGQGRGGGGIEGHGAAESLTKDPSCQGYQVLPLCQRGQGQPVPRKAVKQIAAQAVGLAQGALDEAVMYAKVREQFGKPIIANQGLSWMLADMATKVETARALTYAVVKTIDSGAKDYSKFSAMCKVYASDIAMQVTTDAVQVFGGYGYMKEYPVEKMMRDAKILQIYEGTNQIQRDIIGLALNKEYGAVAKS